MEYLFEDSFDFEDDFNQESDIGIEQAVVDEESLVFDLHSLKILQEKITGSIEKSEYELSESEDELSESDDELSEDNNETELFLEEIEIPVPPNSNVTTEVTRCPIIDNNDKPNTIQRCSRTADIYVNQLFGTWEIDSLAMQEIGNDTSKLKICSNHFNYDHKVVHGSAFAVKNIKVNEEQKQLLKITTCNALGSMLANSILQEQPELKKRLSSLEKPESLEEYYEAMPTSLINFFLGLITTIKEKKLMVLARKRKERNEPPPQLDTKKIDAISLFFVSVILTIAFPRWKIWFTHILSSLCRRPKMLGVLYKILYTVRVVSYARDHEVRTQKKRMLAVEPQSRLDTSSNILNIAAIDNIDTKDKTFQYGNIFDAVRATAHATVRMVFQFQRSELDNLDEESLENQDLFGVSSFMEKWQKKVNTIFKKLVCERSEFGVENVDTAIKENINSASFVAPPNVVILEPGKAPSENKHVHEAVDMFLDDFGYTENGILNLVCDEAIYRRMKDYKSEEQKVHCILGQWHTNKAMCSALIAAFSGYGLFGLATQLGVKFLDKFAKVVDYRATFRVLEFIWVAVGVAIHQYCQEKNISISDIYKEDNNLLKVWYNFYQWAGYLKLHKLGIRMANFDLQMHSLMAFAPLFPATRKYRYAESVAQFLSDLRSNPQFLQDLRSIPSVNLTREGKSLAYDESLETYGVKFLKENMTGRATDLENLKLNMKAAQAEYDRLNLLISEFAGGQVVNKKLRSVKGRLEALWKLINELKLAFSSQQPESHTLFAETTQLTNKGYQQMFTSYEKGINRLNNIVEQDIHKTAAQVRKGRGMPDITPMNVMKSKKRSRKEIDNTMMEIVPQSTELCDDMEAELTNEDLQSLSEPSESTSQRKRATHIPTDAEEEILKKLEEYKDYSVLPPDIINNLVKSLSDITEYWTRKRIRDRWYNRYKRKNT
ncbi:hypothetical protein C2G38_2136489 [Gigaspora rosea]|uniref:Uncharacterized protein n=1 Tax=Gigaspora rosea TaxID=44941 RepID=A0A397VIB8_9GLOM|nr:hypothetical protein C2G38_2035920 [Gigaspora rosea]RIB30178.1 hypothetical protein C2G38_2136489 [Gigaspora rosea]